MNRKDTPAVAGARRVARWHKKQWGVHAKTCWQCRNATGDLKRMCGEGRHIAELFHAAIDVVHETVIAEKGRKGQEELFLWHPGKYVFTPQTTNTHTWYAKSAETYS